MDVADHGFCFHGQAPLGFQTEVEDCVEHAMKGAVRSPGGPVGDRSSREEWLPSTPGLAANIAQSAAIFQARAPRFEPFWSQP